MVSRREFVRIAASAPAWIGASRAERGLGTQTAPSPQVLKPRRLSPGDTVAIVAPASATFFPVELDIARETFEAMGLSVKVGEHVLSRYGYLSGRDEERAADLNRFFADPGVNGIVALRGGWGSARLLPHLDYYSIAKNPKVLLGYSDVTALLCGIHARTGLVTFHGPVGISRWNTFNRSWLDQVIFRGRAVTFENPARIPEGELVQREHRIRTITGGRARGRLIGGNLSVLTAIVGSPFVPDFSGAILFLEDTDEAPYRLDRMLTQLKLAGILAKLRGVVFGRCTECEPGEGTYASLTLEEILTDHVKPLGIPAWHGAAIGHIATQFTLPVGTSVEIDADRGTIRMLEPAVL